jgi:PKD repeat protein
VVRGVPATFRATVVNAAGASWHWVVSTDAGSAVAESRSAGTFRHTFPAGSPDRLQVRVTVTTPVGTDTATAGFTTTSTSTPAPAIGSVVASPPNPDVGQRVTFTADEPVAGARGSWTWRIATVAGGQVLPPTPRAALAPFTHSFTAVGSYRVTLTVAFAGHTDTKSVDVTVGDTCVLQGDSSTIDFRTATTATVTVTWRNCFAAAAPTVLVAGWLGQTATRRPGAPGAGTLTARVGPSGAAPAEALQANAIRFVLGAQSLAVDAFPPVSTPPDAVTLRVGSDRTITGLGGPSTTLGVSGPEFATPGEAGATDGYGPVTSVEMQRTVPGYTCINPDTGETAPMGSEGGFEPFATGQGATVSARVTTPPLPCPPMMVQDTMQFTFRARATGPGGTTGFTGEIHVHWTR